MFQQFMCEVSTELIITVSFVGYIHAVIGLPCSLLTHVQSEFIWLDWVAVAG